MTANAMPLTDPPGAPILPVENGTSPPFATRSALRLLGKSFLRRPRQHGVRTYTHQLARPRSFRAPLGARVRWGGWLRRGADTVEVHTGTYPTAHYRLQL